MDLRQVVAGALTLAMFVMLGDMIKRDHFDSLEKDQLLGTDDVNFESGKLDYDHSTHVRMSIGLWKGDV